MRSGETSGSPASCCRLRSSAALSRMMNFSPPAPNSLVHRSRHKDDGGRTGGRGRHRCQTTNSIWEFPPTPPNRRHESAARTSSVDVLRSELKFVRLCGNYCQFPAKRDVNGDAVPATDLIMSPIGYNDLPRRLPPSPSSFSSARRHATAVVVGYRRKGMRRQRRPPPPVAPQLFEREGYHSCLCRSPRVLSSAPCSI